MGLPSPSIPRALAVLAALATLAGLAVAGRIVQPAHGAPSDLFFSEYVEGSASNKALEIYNGTGAAVTLTGTYDVQLFANGSATATATIPLTGTVADGDVFVLARSTAIAAVLAQADQTTTNFLHNGNDSVALRKAGVSVDVIGQIGADPGVEWGSGDVTTADHTLRRKPDVQAGDPDGSDAFDPVAQWDGFPIDSFDGLGSHAVSAGGGSNQAPDARDDDAVLDEDESAAPIDVLANDVDADGDPLTITAASDPAHGAVAVTGGAALAYTPDVDFNGADSFTYTVSDGSGGVDTATVSLVVDPVNDDPEPEDDTASMPEDGSVTIEVLANDVDPDGDALVVTEVGGALHGALALSPGGTGVVYVPDPDFNGTEVFEYAVSDGNEGTETGEVAVTVVPVNDPPVAAVDAVTVRQGESVVVDVAANDSPGPGDEAGQALAIVSVGAAAHGVAELVADGPDAGKVRYTPSPGYRGSDSFAYDVSDGSATAAGTVTILVQAARLKPPCGLAPTIVGTPGDDVIEGTPGDDVIRAKRGNDVVHGNGGNDVVCAGPGADRVTTEGGDDRIAGGSGDDVVSAGAGDDRLRGGFGKDTIAAGAGDDLVAAGFGNDTVDAGDGRNRVAAGPGDDRVTAGPGDDRLDGGPGTDSCDADGGRNVVLRCE